VLTCDRLSDADDTTPSATRKVFAAAL